MIRRKAIPEKECIYPRCESCRNYVELDGKHYCNVPMVISKQERIMLKENIQKMEKEIFELEQMVEWLMVVMDSPKFYVEGDED